MAKLNWSVQHSDDGKIARRKVEGDNLLDQDYIDVEWTHQDGFPEDTITVPVTHPPFEKHEVRKIGARQVVKDQLIVSPSTSDAVIMALLDEKRANLARALGVQP